MENSSKRQISQTQSILFSCAAFVIVVAGMRAAQDVLIPFLLAIFIATICNPLVLLLQKKHIHQAFAIFFVFLLMIAFGFGITSLLGTSLNEFSNNFPQYQILLKSYAEDIISFLENRGLSISGQILLEQFDPGAVMSLTSGILSRLGSIITNTFLIIFMVVFMLVEANIFKDKIMKLFKGTDERLEQFASFTYTVKRYMLIKTALSMATGIFATVWLILLDVNYPFLWGFLTFLLNYIPTIGSNIAAIPPVLMALIQYDLFFMFLVALGYLVINNVIGSLLEPRIMGQGMGISPLVVFVSLIFWGWVFGPIGMILCVPMTTIIKIAFANTEKTQWISTLLESPVRSNLR
jgi:predicted PurR-regulated permease PerM